MTTLRTPQQIQADVDRHTREIAEVRSAVMTAALHGAQTPAGASNRAIEADYTITPEDLGELQADGEIGVRTAGPVLLIGGQDPLGGPRRDGLLDAQTPRNEWHADLLQTFQARSLLIGCNRGQTPRTERLDRRIARLIAKGPEALREPLNRAFGVGHGRAFDGGTGTGAEWRETRIVPRLERALTSARVLASNFQTLNVPSRNFNIPFNDRDAVPYLMGSPSGDTPGQIRASSVATSDRQRVIANLAVRVVMSQDAAEDSIFDVMGEIEASVLRALVDGEEDAMLNGSTATTHPDTIASWRARSRWPATGMGGTDDHRRAWYGLRNRAIALASNGAADASPTYASIMTAKAALEGAQSAGTVFLVTSPEVYAAKIASIPEVATLDKIGPRASVLTGQVASIGGMPILLSDFITADMNASGQFDGATTTKSGYVIVNSDRFRVCNWRGMTLESQKDISRQIWDIVATTRRTFACIDGDTAKNVAYRYNI